MRITSRGCPLCPRDSGGLLGRQRQDPPLPSQPSEPTPPPTPLSPTIREITLGETIKPLAVAGPPYTTTHGWPRRATPAIVRWSGCRRRSARAKKPKIPPDDQPF